MSTRKLILLALACGLAILVAGSVQLLRIQRGGSATLAVGDSTELATVTASVIDATSSAASISVVVRLRVADRATTALDDAQVGWSLLTGGLKQPATPVSSKSGASGAPPSCAGLRIAAGETRDCVLSFPVAPGGKGTTYVTYRFAGQQPATWTLPL